MFRGNMPDGRVVAVKRLNQSPQAEEELLIDIEINTTLSHTHIVSLLGYCVESSHMLLVYDYLSEGNLEDHLHGKSLTSHRLLNRAVNDILNSFTNYQHFN